MKEQPITYPPLLASDVTEDWIARAKYAAQLPDVEVRVHGNTIQSRYVHSAISWQAIMLQHGGVMFTDELEARKIFELIKP